MAREPDKAIRYTVEQWESLQHALRSMSPNAIQVARRVLVDGVPAPDAAREFGYSRQGAHLAVNRVLARLEKFEIEKLMPTLVWVPESAVEQVKARARELGGMADGDDKTQ